MVTRSNTATLDRTHTFLVTTTPTSEPSNINEALSSQEWFSAMKTEYDALLANKTWTLVPYDNQMTLVDNKWVFGVKYNMDGNIQRYKARLVAKGFQQTPGVNYFKTFAPVVKPCTIRIIITLAVHYNWKIQEIDINNAFLNGDLAETMYMTQPTGFIDSTKPVHVCKLNKALHGLKQAPRAWFEKLK